jgi:hypothetical protein
MERNSAASKGIETVDLMERSMEEHSECSRENQMGILTVARMEWTWELQKESQLG